MQHKCKVEHNVSCCVIYSKDEIPLTKMGSETVCCHKYFRNKNRWFAWNICVYVWICLCTSWLPHNYILHKSRRIIKRRSFCLILIGSSGRGIEQTKREEEEKSRPGVGCVSCCIRSYSISLLQRVLRLSDVSLPITYACTYMRAIRIRRDICAYLSISSDWLGYAQWQNPVLRCSNAQEEKERDRVLWSFANQIRLWLASRSSSLFLSLSFHSRCVIRVCPLSAWFSMCAPCQ